MQKTVIYKYLGTNGVLETPIHLENIYSIKTYLLKAEPGYILTNGVIKCSQIKVAETEVDLWTEVPIGQD